MNRKLKSLILTGLFLVQLPFFTIAGNDLSSSLSLTSRPVHSKFSAGIYGGVNYANVYFNNRIFISDSYLVQTQSTFLPTIGFALNYKSSEKWRLQGELLIEQNGMHYTDVLYSFYQTTQLQTEVKNTLKLYHYTIPLMAQYQFGRVVRGFIEAGAFYSKLKKAHEVGVMKSQVPSTTQNSIVTQVDHFEFIKSAAYKSDFGILAGAGLEVPLAKGIWGPSTSLIFNVRYRLGLVDIYKGEEIEEQNPVEEIIGINPIVEDPADANNVFKTNAIVIRFGLVFAI